MKKRKSFASTQTCNTSDFPKFRTPSQCAKEAAKHFKAHGFHSYQPMDKAYVWVEIEKTDNTALLAFEGLNLFTRDGNRLTLNYAGSFGNADPTYTFMVYFDTSIGGKLNCEMLGLKRVRKGDV